ncbi:MAG TPA: DUF4113 domain-containing protein [Puia sp.]|nr:DUF4113 domain-containing protein [Puia sp.]
MAVGLVDQLFENGKTYKKAGVMLSGLVPDDSIQGMRQELRSKRHTTRWEELKEVI